MINGIIFPIQMKTHHRIPNHELTNSLILLAEMYLKLPTRKATLVIACLQAPKTAWRLLGRRLIKEEVVAQMYKMSPYIFAEVSMTSEFSPLRGLCAGVIDTLASCACTSINYQQQQQLKTDWETIQKNAVNCHGESSLCSSFQEDSSQSTSSPPVSLKRTNMDRINLSESESESNKKPRTQHQQQLQAPTQVVDAEEADSNEATVEEDEKAENQVDISDANHLNPTADDNENLRDADQDSLKDAGADNHDHTASGRQCQCGRLPAGASGAHQPSLDIPESLKDFVDKHCELDDKYEASASELRERYTDKYKEHSINKNQFGKRLFEHFCKKKCKGGKLYYLGLRLREEVLSPVHEKEEC